MGRWPRSCTEKAQREVIRRSENYKMKRFNDPLKIYIERKHPEIFAEYTEFYRYLDTKEPTRKNLSTSPAFKKWLKDNLTFTPIPESEIPVSTKLTDIIGRLRKVESSLKQVKSVINEREATQVHESVINEATSLQGIEPMNANPTQTLETLIDQLMEDDVWQELLNQDLSGIYDHIEMSGGL